ncbi:MAG: transketolase C-terminal domain-containing protein [Merdibacter sp.]
MKAISSDLFKGSRCARQQVAVIATGQLVQEALKAYDMVEEKPTVINIHTIKPIDEELITETARTA